MGFGSWLKENIVEPVIDPVVAEGERFGERVIGAGEDVIDFVKDPLGVQDAAQEASEIAEESTMTGVQMLEEQQQTVEDLYADYYEQAVSGALPDLQAMIMGGDVDYTPSKLYEYQKELGTRNIRRIQAAKGKLGSSGTEQRLAGFYGDLAAEEAERMYGGTLSQLQIGSGAASAISAAGGTMAGNVGSLYSNLGQQQANITQQAGGARQALYQSYSNALSGLSQYMM